MSRGRSATVRRLTEVRASLQDVNDSCHDLAGANLGNGCDDGVGLDLGAFCELGAPLLHPPHAALDQLHA